MTDLHQRPDVTFKKKSHWPLAEVELVTMHREPFVPTNPARGVNFYQNWIILKILKADIVLQLLYF